MATVLSRAITLVVALWVLFIREKVATFKIPKLKEIINSWKSILYIALPATASKVILPLAIGFVTRLISTYGSDAVAAYGIGSRIEMFALSIVMALSVVVGPVIGQNLGAGKIDRVNKVIKYSTRFSILWSLLLYIPLSLYGSITFGLNGIFAGLSITYFLSGIISYIVIKMVLINIKKVPN